MCCVFLALYPDLKKKKKNIQRVNYLESKCSAKRNWAWLKYSLPCLTLCCLHGCSSQYTQIWLCCFHLKCVTCIYFFMNGKSRQMTHFSCNIPYTAQVYSGKPREGQYSRHHDIKEGSETKPTKRISRETTVLASITFNTSLNRIAQLWVSCRLVRGLKHYDDEPFACIFNINVM